MVGLNRKGTVALIDAMVFLSLMSVVAVGIFAYIGYAEIEEPMAKSVTDDLFSVKVKASDLTDSEDSKLYPIAVLISANMASGDTEFTERYLAETMDCLIPEMYGYVLALGYEGHLLSVERTSLRDISSDYSSEINIDGAGTLSYRLVIM